MSQEISLQEAVDMTTRYRANKPSNFAVCETFQVDIINTLLSVEGCAFLRVYYGMKTDLSAHAILVAADADGQDLLPSVSDQSASTSGDAIIAEDGIRCPPDCPPPSPLNGE